VRPLKHAEWTLEDDKRVIVPPGLSKWTMDQKTFPTFLHFARYRRAFYPSRAKDDPVYSQLLDELISPPGIIDLAQKWNENSTFCASNDGIRHNPLPVGYRYKGCRVMPGNARAGPRARGPSLFYGPGSREWLEWREQSRLRMRGR
jgi:hypothetical protein